MRVASIVSTGVAVVAALGCSAILGIDALPPLPGADAADGAGADVTSADVDVGDDVEVAADTGVIDLGDAFPTSPSKFLVNANAPSVDVGDLDGDGRLDLAVAIFGGSVGLDVLRGLGDGGFEVARGYGSGVFSIVVKIADVSGDGRPDVVLANGTDGSRSLQVFVNTSSVGVFSLAAPVSYGLGSGSWNSLAIGDVDEDGHSDLVTGDAIGNVVDVAFNDGAGGFGGAPLSLTVGNRPQSVIVADLDGDGHLDVATSNRDDSSVSVVLGNGSARTFRPAVSYDAGALRPQSMAAGDMNGDGKLDLVLNINVAAGTVAVLLNDGSGRFTAKAPGSPFLTDGPFEDSLAVADLDRDGRLDVASTNFGNCCRPASGSAGSLSLLRGVGDGALEAPSVFPPPADDNVHGVAVGDLDADGRPDVVITTKVTHYVFVYMSGH